ncbi:SPOR domain-containing protein [Legionella fallonii]|uniref:SPOR domain-containing protein n=1 Tax=Legionella fallonii LLAP-10 TaxID=1212491 RepID=A0A098G2J9_9GAMM|nr:SPOR domain-containing protein [Legionella fallonii]CEG56214.1 conserved protein of unknown function [Legionella fallonii LLAP-10]
MIRKCFYSVLAFEVILASITIGAQDAAAQTIFGLGMAQQFTQKANSNFYIQAGSFTNKSRAIQYQYFLQSKTTYPIKIVKNNNFYRVIIGPIHRSSEVRRVGRLMSSSMKTKPITISARQKPVSQKTKQNHIEQQSKTSVVTRVTPVLIPAHNTANWFVSVGGGAQFPQFNSNMVVNNNSDFPPPFDVDIYSTSNTSQGIIGVTAGRRWERDSQWFPSYSLGVLYQYFFETNAGGTVMQYSLPEFTNYTYNLNLSSNVVMASAKLNLFDYAQKLSPFVNGGIGGAFNKASGYSEAALPGVTPRITPGFTDNTTNQFAYMVGAGLDYKIKPQLIVSVGYNYVNLGHFSSGLGMQTWSGQSLNLGTYQSNDVFASVSYLFEK